ncbi:MAG: hypothetical protein ACREVW_08755 [Burkholderiales bacterium]
MPETGADGIDWSLTTWEGARREQLRRWAALPLERIVLALEEMQELAEWLSPGVTDDGTTQRPHDEPS